MPRIDFKGTNMQAGLGVLIRRLIFYFLVVILPNLILILKLSRSGF